MGKLVTKTALITLACFLAFVLILFGVLSLIFPSVMLTITDHLGMEKASTSYAVSVYNRTGEIEDLAEVVEYGYASQTWKVVSEYGDRFISKKDFRKFCEKKDHYAQIGNSPAEQGNENSGEWISYSQYYTSIISEAQYRVGNKKESIRTAFLMNRDQFSSNNAVMFLSVIAMDAKDYDFTGQILNELKSISETVDFDSEPDGKNLSELIEVLSLFMEQQETAAE